MFAFAISAYPQVKSDKITPYEAKEANALAHRFAKRLLETKDVRQLTGEFFVRDFSQRLWLEVNGHYWQILRHDQVRPERRTSLFRYYVAEINFIYLFTLISTSLGDIQHLTPPDTDDDYNAFQAYIKYLPSEVKSAFDRDEEIWKLIQKNEKAFDVDKPETSEAADHYFDRTLRFLDRIVPVLRRAAIRINAGRGTSFQKNMLQLAGAGDISTYKPFEVDCDDSCYGFEKGNRIIYVEFLPLFQLTFSKLSGRLRVIDFQFAVP